MVVAMKDIDKFSRSRVFGHKMEDKTMHNVFKQSPEDHSADKQDHDTRRIKCQCVTAKIDQANHYRQVNTPDHQWMSLRKYFQVLALEQTGLSLIMDLVKMHSSQIFPRQR